MKIRHTIHAERIIYIILRRTFLVLCYVCYFINLNVLNRFLIVTSHSNFINLNVLNQFLIATLHSKLLERNGTISSKRNVVNRYLV